ncbi:MAG TPA: hypothetical protein VEB69_01185 [Acidimicrobiia bacterium]|nr:hypothetical protein [Acidimicrobiia bacterium]
MGRRIIWLLACALVLVSCDAASSQETTTTSLEATTTTRVTDPGRLVIIDDSGDVVVMAPDGTNQTAITDDGGDSAAYTQPIWAPDGQGLAFGRVTSDGFSVGLHDLGSEETTTIATGNLPFYMSFSPQGDRLGVLHNGSTGIDFNLVDVVAGSIERVDMGAPFYFSWSPNNDRLVTHVGVDRFETIDLTGQRTSLEPTGPTYLAPQWTPSGVFHVVDDTLVVETADGTRNAVAGVSGFTMFVTNEQGTLVAMQSSGADGGVEVALEDPPIAPSNRVVVVDTTTGDVSEVTDGLALGFFWSPNGENLLALNTGDQSATPRVWNVEGTVADYPGYLPPATMLQDTFPFFPQYAQSVSFWAPDSSAFAYAGEVEGVPGIWVQSLGAEEPEMVSAGRWVAWSG